MICYRNTYLLQEYIFVALDIFHEIVQTIDTELDVWLHFQSFRGNIFNRIILKMINEMSSVKDRAHFYLLCPPPVLHFPRHSFKMVVIG